MLPSSLLKSALASLLCSPVPLTWLPLIWRAGRGDMKRRKGRTGLGCYGRGLAIQSRFDFVWGVFVTPRRVLYWGLPIPWCAEAFSIDLQQIPRQPGASATLRGFSIHRVHLDGITFWKTRLASNSKGAPLILGPSPVTAVALPLLCSQMGSWTCQCCPLRAGSKCCLDVTWYTHAFRSQWFQSMPRRLTCIFYLFRIYTGDLTCFFVRVFCSSHVMAPVGEKKQLLDEKCLLFSD